MRTSPKRLSFRGGTYQDGNAKRFSVWFAIDFRYPFRIAMRTMLSRGVRKHLNHVNILVENSFWFME